MTKQELRDLKQKVFDREVSFQRAKILYDSMFRKMVRAAAPQLNRPDGAPQELGSFDVIVSGWECEDSPTGYCAYDALSWNGTDECMFCGEPEERK